MACNYVCIDSFDNEHLTADGVCKIPDDTDFAYIMRQDAAYVAGKLFPTMDTAVVHTLYEGFVDNLAGVLKDHFAHYGKVAIYSFDAGFLEQAQRQIAHPGDISVSLDPLLIGDGIVPLGVSRHYFPGGVEEKRIAARPGFPALQTQIAALCGRQNVTVFEDDVFSGSSIRGLAAQMKEAGAQMGLVVPGIQVGDPAALADSGIACQPIVKIMGDKRDLRGRVDLGDPRDFLLGADGLVIDFSADAVPCLGRAPYITPFTSPTARLNIPPDREGAFSRDILELNISFYKSLADQHGHVSVLGDTDGNFQETIGQYQLAASVQTPMIDIAVAIRGQMEPLRAKTTALHAKAKGVHHG